MGGGSEEGSYLEVSDTNVYEQGLASAAGARTTTLPGVPDQVPPHQPSALGQIAFLRSLILPGARRNPAASGANQGN